MKIGVADYGMNVWYGGMYDIAARLSDLKKIGYDGIERLEAASPSEAIAKSIEFKKLGMDFTTCRGSAIDSTIAWTAALGKAYVWTQVGGKDFDTFCRQVNDQAKAAAKFGVKVGIHNHLGSLVETQAQLEDFLGRCPDCGIIYDTGHLAAAGGDVLAIVKKYSKRILVMHLKDWKSTGSTSPVNNGEWYKCGYFTTLGKGNIGQDNAAVIKELKTCGYDGWVFVEHDTHLQDPLMDLSESRQYLKHAGV
ncbi:MAG: sugar phosphate isomerase/epimerase [Victivallales bacterium]